MWQHRSRGPEVREKVGWGQIVGKLEYWARVWTLIHNHRINTDTLSRSVTLTNIVPLPLARMCQVGSQYMCAQWLLNYRNNALWRLIYHIHRKVELKNRRMNVSFYLNQDMKAFCYDMGAFSFALYMRKITA